MLTRVVRTAAARLVAMEAKAAEEAKLVYPRLHIQDRARVDAKLAKMVSDGIGKLQVITDFDATLTHPRGLSSWGVIEKSHLTSQEYRDRVYELYKKYYPIEIDPVLTIAEKSVYMVEWWNHATEVFLAEKFTAEKFKEMVVEANGRVFLRDGCDELFEQCAKFEVPLLIFSAGVGNVIDELVNLKNLNTAQMHVIANRLVFDEKTRLASHYERDEPIHVFNKQESLIFGTPYHAQVASRGNVLLMGDSLGDVNMSQGMEHDTVFRIGFLNVGVGKNVEQFIPEYGNKFDIVLIGDGTLNVALAVFRSIVQGGKEGATPITCSNIEEIVRHTADTNPTIVQVFADGAPPPKVE